MIRVSIKGFNFCELFFTRFLLYHSHSYKPHLYNLFQRFYVIPYFFPLCSSQQRSQFPLSILKSKAQKLNLSPIALLMHAPCKCAVFSTTNSLISGTQFTGSLSIIKSITLPSSSSFPSQEAFSPRFCKRQFFVSWYSSKSRYQFPRRKSKMKPSTPSAPPSELFQQSLSELPPRFKAEDLHRALSLQKDPQACLLLFNWASQQSRFRHNVSTFLVILKKLGAAQLFAEFDAVVSHAFSLQFASETLFNTIIYFYTESRKLSKAVLVYKHMKKCKDLNCRPSVRTYNLLFSAMLSRGNNSYINHMYMETIRCLFRQMVDDGIEPDAYSLNAMIKGYVLSLHVNDALRIFHQMGVVYKCLPNAFSYSYLIHGLSAQGRSMNAKELFEEMKNKGFVPSRKAYNSFVNCLAIGGKVDEAVRILWEMKKVNMEADLITFRTVVDSLVRHGRIDDARRLLCELREKEMLDDQIYAKLKKCLQVDFGSSDGVNEFGSFGGS